MNLRESLATSGKVKIYISGQTKPIEGTVEKDKTLPDFIEVKSKSVWHMIRISSIVRVDKELE